jgi:pimeloyl-ACP methyl ester carboxylesterase
LVSGNSYNIQNIDKSMEPIPAAQEAALWYQYYFQSERGRRGLTIGRQDIALQLWKMWSPAWDFDEATFNATASAFDNPDFVDIVIHSYRHRYGLVASDPMHIDMEAKLAYQPPICVPAITIDGDMDGVNIGTAHHSQRFNGPHEHRIFSQAGHNLPQERPVDWAQAVLDARAMALV